MDYIEKQTASEKKYSGIIVDVRVDDIELYNGAPAKREVVEHGGGVCVIALDADKCITAVRQYRYPVGESLIEIPAGKLEKGEDPYLAAMRELEEETGLRTDKLIPFGLVYSSPGFCSEHLYIYLAENCTQGEAHPDEDEFLDVLKIPLDDFAKMVMSGEIKDGKTCICVLKTLQYLSEREAQNE